MPGFRPQRRHPTLAATPGGRRPSPLRGYNPLYPTDPTQAVPAPGTVPGSDSFNRRLSVLRAPATAPDREISLARRTDKRLVVSYVKDTSIMDSMFISGKEKSKLLHE
jgi:hypothetical protein